MCEARRLVHYSTLGLGVITKREEREKSTRVLGRKGRDLKRRCSRDTYHISPRILVYGDTLKQGGGGGCGEWLETRETELGSVESQQIVRGCEIVWGCQIVWGFEKMYGVVKLAANFVGLTGALLWSAEGRSSLALKCFRNLRHPTLTLGSELESLGLQIVGLQQIMWGNYSKSCGGIYRSVALVRRGEKEPRSQMLQKLAPPDLDPPG